MTDHQGMLPFAVAPALSEYSVPDVVRELMEPVHTSWASILDPLQPEIRDIATRLVASASEVLPTPNRMLAALSQPRDHVRVVILGQDPYPTRGHAHGLAFSTEPHVRPHPRSLANIFREYTDDLGFPAPQTGDLRPWQQAGVMLLNPVLSVPAGIANGHAKLGWQSLTGAVLRALITQDMPPVGVLWGAKSAQLWDNAGGTDVRAIRSPHPSPLSARKGFFGSRPFSGANSLLAEQDLPPVDWRLP